MAESASLSPSVSPSVSPSPSPSASPSASPSVSPSKSPSRSPSASPSASPSPIPSTGVTYTIRDRVRIGKKYLVFAAIAFGGTNEYYPNGGIALTTGSLGLRSTVNAVVILESNATGYMFEWDRSANTIRMFVSANGTVNTELNDASLASEISLEIMAIGW